MKIDDIQSITPKLFIQDDGTDYDTGEESNGLWPGFGDIGHWKLNEQSGSLAFNNRDRRRRNINLSNVRWNTDTQGNFISYRLPQGEPLVSPSPNLIMMVGSGGGFSSFSNFDNFLKSDGLPPHPLNYQFDIWVKIERPLQDGESETLLYLHDTSAETSFHRVLKFAMERDNGQLSLNLYCVHENREEWSKVYSEEAGDFIDSLMDKGISGLIQLAFVYRIGSLNKLQFRTSEDEVFRARSSDYPRRLLVWDPDASQDMDFSDRALSFYVNGRSFEVDLETTNDWYKGGITLDVNPLIGCQISSDAPQFSGRRNSPNQEVAFNQHFTGKIYAIQWNNAFENPSPERMATLFNLKFDVPRGPSWVDFSDFEETKGKNLLKNMGRISQAIENKQGNFYVTLNRVTMRNT